MAMLERCATAQRPSKIPRACCDCQRPVVYGVTDTAAVGECATCGLHHAIRLSERISEAERLYARRLDSTPSFPKERSA